MDFQNSTELDGDRLQRLLIRHTYPYRHERLKVRVRYSRGADFSGTCFYSEARIFVNLGRHVRFPYQLGTHIARAQCNATHWWRETFRLVLTDPYQLALFVYLHELYHYLVKTAQRNPRRKEAMCDRFATRVLVDQHGCAVIGARGQPVARHRWDFQDVDAFVAAAPRVPTTLFDLVEPRPPRPIPVRVLGVRAGARRKRRTAEHRS
jgi:hypothetical protein